MESMIDKAAQLNKEIKKLEKELNTYKTSIKEGGIGSFEGENYVADVSKRVRQRTFNQEKALDIVKKLGAKWLLKQVVDEEKLEDAIATGEIDGKEFKDCIDVTYNTVITFKEKKK